MIDVIYLTIAVADVDQGFEHINDVLVGQRTRPGNLIPA